MQYIAVQGCTLTISGVTPGTAIITSSPSTKVKAGGSYVYKGTVNVQLTGCSSGTYQQTSTATGTFTNTAAKVKVENDLVLLENDLATGISIPMQNSVFPFDSTSFTASVQITSAGQTKVKGN